MRHFNDHLDEAMLLDAAEGARPDDVAAHLARCERCRVQVEELTAVMQMAEDVPAPEPSPLFWDRLSARVREAVAEEAAGERAAEPAGWAARLWKWQTLASAVAVAAVIMAVAVNRRSSPETSAVHSPAATEPAVAATLGDLTPSVDDDPSLSFIADLAGDLDWDDAVEAGLTSGAGAVDRVVQDMSDDERRELRRVLQEEMGRPGA